jgi:hypothetical protein
MKRYFLKVTVAIGVGILVWMNLRQELSKASPHHDISYKSAAMSSTSSITNPISVKKSDLASENTRFATYAYLSRKAVMTIEEKDLLNSLLSNSEKIDEADSILSASKEEAYSLANQQFRQKVVEYLGKAIEWKENPERQHAIRVAEKVARRDPHLAPQDILLNRSFAGDQIELFQILTREDVSLAKQIYDDSVHSKSQNLIAYAISNELENRGVTHEN